MICEQEGCDEEGFECGETPMLAHYCPAHAAENGFCAICGQFWGGVETFEFIHPGLCDNCNDQILRDQDDGEEDCFDDWEPSFDDEE